MSNELFDLGEKTFHTFCPWCECSSRTPDFCSECGKDIYAEEGTEVCVYCGNERGGKFSCCGEVHFEQEYHMRNRK